MCIGIMSNIFWPTVSDFNTGAWPNLVRTFFLPLKCCNCICPKHNMFLKSASDSPFHVIRKFIMFVQLSDLHVRVHFGVVAKLVMLLLVGTLVLNRLVKRIFPMERLIVPIQSPSVATISEYPPPSDPLAVLQIGSDIDSDIDGHQDDNDWMPLFWIAKCVAILPNTQLSVPVTTSSLTHLHGAAPEIHAKTSGTADLRDCKGPTTRVNTGLGGKICEETHNIAERNANRSQNRPTRRYSPSGPSCTYFILEKREGDG